METAMKLTGMRLTLLVLTVLWQGTQLLVSSSADEFTYRLAWCIGVCLWSFVVLQAIEVVVNGREAPPKTKQPAQAGGANHR